MAYVEVAVDAPVGVDRTFSYRVPDSMSPASGQVALVPFGRRLLTGVVFEVTDRPQVERTRDLVELVEPGPLLRPPQLALARWISGTYLSPLFPAASLMLPPDVPGPRSRAVVARRRPGPEEWERLSPAQRRVVEYVGERGRVAESRLRRQLGPAVDRTLPSLERRGLVLREEGRRRAPAARARSGEVLVGVEAGAEEPDRLRRRGAWRQAGLLEHLLGGDGRLRAAEARRLFGQAPVAALVRRGVARLEAAPAARPGLAGRGGEPEAPPPLTPHQEHALLEVRAALDGPPGTPRSFLLEGVTGSGKTEVYLRALGEAVSRGYRGLVLVPEIALTPQTVERFARRFPGRVAVLHSALRRRERRDTWWGVWRGEADVVVGSRSALFAPVERLGLVVVDEEHEWTYKQAEGAPRYHAREAALELARLSGAVAILGSATPDVGTRYRSEREVHRRLELPARIGVAGGGGRLAEVDVVDMRRELRSGNRSLFSRTLRRAVDGALDRGGQVILFLNRRGTSSHVQCRDCGHTLRCRRCDTSLTYHGVGERLVCHLCGERSPLARSCPACGGSRVRYLGAGTQRVVDEVRSTFPGAAVERWDRDAARTSDEHDHVLRRFLRGEVRVLVGTQMVARGLHVPNVVVVGVLLADLGLHVPDFRAPERVFQLLCQMAGRAGRGEVPGRAIIQTYRPHDYAIQAAASQSYDDFYAEELPFRRSQQLPPFSRLARLAYGHTNQARCEEEAQGLGRVLRRKLRALGKVESDVIGPAPAFPSRVRGRYQWHLLVRSSDPAALLREVELPPGWTVDVDPVTVA